MIAVETLSGVPRDLLRPDLYAPVAAGGDEIDAARAAEYRLLAALLARAPDAALLTRLARLKGDETPLGMAHIALGEAAAKADAAATQREYFHLFIGLGRGEFLPYASYYLTGFLQERPLAAVRRDFAKLGLARADDRSEPEDHIASLLDAMADLSAGSVGAHGDEKRFFETHLRPWVERFFSELELSDEAKFYRAVARAGREFMAIEAQAFALPS